MRCDTLRPPRLFRWRHLPWRLALPALPLALWACSSHPLQQPESSAQQETDFEVNISPQRKIDILFMIDNSPSMDQEQANIARNFPLMIDQLKNLPGGLPDLHLGIVDSDVGAGGITCNDSQPGGDWGLLWGNPDPSTDKANFANVTTRRESPDPNGCGLNRGVRWIEDFQNGKQKNYTGDISDVFSCMAKVGTLGCGYEHQLQAIRVALKGQPDNEGFLRDDAYLAIILVTDEDDCSAEQSDDLNKGIFNAALNNETASLRCAAQGHICNGNPIPWDTIGNGFDPPSPNKDQQVAFQTDFKSCAPRTDKGNPLIQVQTFIDDIRSLKDRPDDQIIVAGIYGWPMPGTEATAQYKIGKDPDPDLPSMANLWDYLPICESPGLGKAYGGLRHKAFIDAFHGLSFPICMDDFKGAMQQIGTAITRKIMPSCVDYWLVDTDGDPSNGVQAECTVVQRVPVAGNRAHPYDETQIPQCDISGTLPCWKLVQDKDRCPATGQKIQVDRASGQDATPDTLVDMKCLTCPDANDTRLCPH